MSHPPNQAIGELAAVMGHDATREIVRLFLREFPESMRRLRGGGREDQIRIVHGLKSSALHMGATGLSERMAAVEDRLASPGATLGPVEIAAAIADFEAVAPELQRYAET